VDRQDLIKAAEDFVENSKYNYIDEKEAISEDVIGMKIFEKPIFAFGSASDEYFLLLKKPSAVGKHFMAPKEWLPNSRTVISFFLPFSEIVRKGNRNDMLWPSKEWLHGRIEGQNFLNKLCSHLKSKLIEEGYDSVVPSLDERFWSVKFEGGQLHPELSFTSNWSERHVGFVCGLGSFGLSRGLITQKGMSGRIGSIVTELYLSPDERKYKNVYEYCIMCGKCAKNCPSRAISIERGKDHIACARFLDKTSEKYKPRYGCGKCQVEVPCEFKIPKKSC
jgi:epoxyqueuosine reductase QueG